MGESKQTLPPGTSLQQGKYHLDAVLGEGGFGITYRASDSTLGRLVAIKELFPKGGSRNGRAVVPPAEYAAERWSNAVKSFAQEARTLAHLRHPGIVGVYDYVAENNTAYMVMEFVDGVTLVQYVRQHGGKLAEAEVVNYVTQVGNALAALHQNNILHRDVTPYNIMLDHAGRAILIDFGSARRFVEDTPMNQTVVANVGFAPPEQFQPFGVRGPYSDIYSLAVTCYFLITGNLPPNQQLPGVSPKLKAALAHAIAVAPQERPQTVAEFLDELHGRRKVKYRPPAPLRAAQQFTTIDAASEETVFEPQLSHPVSTPVYSTTARATAPVVAAVAVDEQARRRPIWLFALGIVALLLLLFGGIALFGGNQNVVVATASSSPTPTLAAASPTSIAANPTIAPTSVVIIPGSQPTTTPPPPTDTSAPTILAPATDTPPSTNTAAPLPPTGTAVFAKPTATTAAALPTARPILTSTPRPPVPPTSTPRPPVPPTSTHVPPAPATHTPAPPTLPSNTPVPPALPTNTLVPPAQPTDTPVPVPPTNTPVPPTNTPRPRPTAPRPTPTCPPISPNC